MTNKRLDDKDKRHKLTVLLPLSALDKIKTMSQINYRSLSNVALDFIQKGIAYQEAVDLKMREVENLPTKAVIAEVLVQHSDERQKWLDKALGEWKECVALNKHFYPENFIQAQVPKNLALSAEIVDEFIEKRITENSKNKQVVFDDEYKSFLVYFDNFKNNKNLVGSDPAECYTAQNASAMVKRALAKHAIRITPQEVKQYLQSMTQSKLNTQ